MKKTIAALSASVLGIGAAVAAAAAPAAAVTPTVQCTDATQHEVNPFLEPGADWYMPCIPQYGMGKAEFTITTPASDPFPAGYSLDDGHQTVTSTPTSAQVKAYFEPEWDELPSPGTAIYTGAFVNLTENPSAGTPISQEYEPVAPITATTDVAFPIVSVGPATAGLPADCTPDSDPTAGYEGEYVVVYGSTTTHFSETIDDVVHSVTVSYTPAPLYIGLNFTGSAGSVDLDENAPICMSSGGNTTFSASESDDEGDWLSAAFSATNLPPELTTLTPANGPIDDPDSLFTSTVVDLGSFDATSTPVLATTGVDTRNAGTLGIGLVVAGILATGIGLLRRRRPLPNSR